MSKELRKRGTQSKIQKYGLMEHAINLLKVTPKMTYREIAEELNTIGNVPEEEWITSENISQFVRNYSDVRREVMLSNRRKLRKMVMDSAEVDMLGHLKDMAARTAFLLETMEEMALNDGTLPDAKDYKALSSEFREIMKQIEGIHKVVYDMQVVREFLVEVIKTLTEVSPESMEAFSERMKGKRENSTIVNELLKGGM